MDSFILFSVDRDICNWPLRLRMGGQQPVLELMPCPEPASHDTRKGSFEPGARLIPHHPAVCAPTDCSPSASRAQGLLFAWLPRVAEGGNSQRPLSDLLSLPPGLVSWTLSPSTSGVLGSLREAERSQTATLKPVATSYIWLTAGLCEALVCVLHSPCSLYSPLPG